MPSAGDAEALRKALAIGAVTATLVAAGAIAAMQGNPAVPAGPQSITAPALVPAPGPAPDFQIRREQAIDKMLEVPAPMAQPIDTTTERLSHVAPAAGAGSGAATTPGAVSVPAAPAKPSTSFEDRREQRADQMLEAPEPLIQPSDVSTN